MKVLGILLILFGVIDLLGAWFFGFDLWGDFIGIELPEIIWTYSGYIEVLVGWLFLRAGSDEPDADEPDADEPDADEPDAGFKMMAGQLPQPREDSDLDDD